MSELFTLESLSIFAEPGPDKITERDPRWDLALARREARLRTSEDLSNPGWLLDAIEFTYDTGRYEDSLAYTKRLTAAGSSGIEWVVARALFFKCGCHLAMGNGGMADRCANKLSRLAASTNDSRVEGIHLLLNGMNRQYNVGHMKQRQQQRGADYALPLFDEAASMLAKTEELDFSIRAFVELARARFEIGNFFSGIDAINQATRLSRDHGSWNHISQIMTLAASHVSDMGYRIGVEDVIRRSIAWSDFVGDRWTHIEGLTVLGRFLYYTMPVGNPLLTAEPDRYLRIAAKEAEQLGVSRLAASIDSTRFFLFRKAGDDKKVQALLGDVSGEEEFREKQLRENRIEIEKIAEERRRKTALRLHDGVEDTQDAFFVFDALRDSTGVCRDFCWAYVNRAAEKIFEQSKFQIFLFSEARLQPQLAGLDDALMNALNNREAFDQVHEVHVESESLWLQRRIVPSGDGVVITIRDVTAEKVIEAALRQAAASAQESEHTKTAFLASMSHEIRTPLNGVLGLARMLAETEMTPLQRGYVNDIVLSGNILLELIGDVLDLSKIEAQEMQLSPAPVSLSSIVSSVVTLFHGQAQERGIGLRFSIDSDVPETVLVDAVRLRQVLSNLVGNAVKFTDHGGIQIHVYTEAQWIVFEVRDTGIGIPEDHIAEVFHRFRQVHYSARGGTGLGLAISKALVEMMGGDLSVESQVGLGSAFYVRLPLPELRVVTPEKHQAFARRFDGGRVLIVDDNEVNLLVSSHVIEKFGCEAVCANSGTEALLTLENETFDLVFMDVKMPGMSGLEVTQEVRRREGQGRHTPIIALTAGALLQEQQACFDAGMDDFVTKPINIDSIQNILNKWLPKA